MAARGKGDPGLTPEAKPNVVDVLAVVAPADRRKRLENCRCVRSLCSRLQSARGGSRQRRFVWFASQGVHRGGRYSRTRERRQTHGVASSSVEVPRHRPHSAVFGDTPGRAISAIGCLGRPMAKTDKIVKDLQRAIKAMECGTPRTYQSS